MYGARLMFDIIISRLTCDRIGSFGRQVIDDSVQIFRTHFFDNEKFSNKTIASARFAGFGLEDDGGNMIAFATSIV